MSNLPHVPAGLDMPEGWELAFTLGCIVVLAGFVGYALVMWRRHRDVVPLLCLVGGAMCTFFEPVVDVLGLCWYPRHGQTTLFETFGRPIPLLVAFGYTWFMGGLTAVAYRRALDGGALAVFRLFPIFLALYLPFEFIAVQTGVYVYYGHQPLRVFDFPVWWAFVNLATPLVAGYVIANLRPVLRGWRVLAVVALVPLFDGATQGATAWPVWSALNSNPPEWVVQLTGLLTCGLAVLFFWVMTRLELRHDLTDPAAQAPSGSKRQVPTR